jgi:hypothetical protein
LRRVAPRASRRLQRRPSRRASAGPPSGAPRTALCGALACGPCAGVDGRTPHSPAVVIESGPRWLMAVGLWARGPGRPEGVAPVTRRAGRLPLRDGLWGTSRAGFPGCALRSLSVAPPDTVSRDARRPAGWEVPARAMLHEPVSQRSGVAGRLAASKQTRHGGPAPSPGPRASSRAVPKGNVWRRNSDRTGIAGRVRMGWPSPLSGGEGSSDRGCMEKRSGRRPRRFKRRHERTATRGTDEIPWGRREARPP